MALRDYTQELIALYRQGETLRSIGKRYGITGERVRQLLKEHGVTYKHGGRHALAIARGAARDAEAQRRKDARALRTFGCTHAEAIAANDGRKLRDPSSFAYAFLVKRANARRDNKSIAWTLTLPEFRDAWAASGLPRGIGSHSGAVVLKDKSLGYVSGNVVVVPLGDFVSRQRACGRQEGRGRWQSSSISS